MPEGTCEPLFQEHDRIHLVSVKGRHYPLTLKAGAVFQYSGETMPHDALIGQEAGREVILSGGTMLVAMKPTLAEYTLKMPRGAQIIYPKDLGQLLIWADIAPGVRVLEAGIGSGALTLALLRAVGPTGLVISYEVREDFLAVALENVRRILGRPPNLQVRLHDIYEGIPDRPVDRLILDLPEPWRVVGAAAVALRPGGIFACYLPTVPQISQVTEALRQHGGFRFVETHETLLRSWNIAGLSVRPEHRMVAHTGFLTTARRIITHTRRGASHEAS